MTTIDPTKPPKWQAKCMDCDWQEPEDTDGQYIEGLATLHKMQTGHMIQLVATGDLKGVSAGRVI